MQRVKVVRHMLRQFFHRASQRLALEAQAQCQLMTLRIQLEAACRICKQSGHCVLLGMKCCAWTCDARGPREAPACVFTPRWSME